MEYRPSTQQTRTAAFRQLVLQAPAPVVARLTQEELASAAGVSPRSVSNLERGINRTAHKDTAVLLAGALGLAGPAEELFVAAARGNVPAAEVLAVAAGAGPRPGVVTGSPYRGLSVFGEQDAGWFFGREAAAAAVLDRMSRLLAGTGLLVVSGAPGCPTPPHRPQAAGRDRRPARPHADRPDRRGDRRPQRRHRHAERR